MGNKICFAVPTFPGHYLYALSFMKSFQEYHYNQQADLFFIFTSPEERDGFLPCQSIVLPKSLRITKNRGIINIKKFYALMQLKDKYEYIIVVDDECLFCQTVDLRGICESFFERKVLYGNIVENPPWDFPHIIPDCCKKFFDKETREKLNCPLYLWFNQIPIYRTCDLKKFFKMTDMGRRIHRLTYNDFDFYIYMFFLIVEHGFEAADIGISADRSVVEVVDKAVMQFKGHRETANIFMSTQCAKDFLELENVFLLCHCDREEPLSVPKGKVSRMIAAVKDYFRIKRILS